MLKVTSVNQSLYLISRYLNNGLVTSVYEFALVIESDVLENCTSMKTTASGYNNISSFMLLHNIAAILPYITYIIDTCIGCNTVSYIW